MDGKACVVGADLGTLLSSGDPELCRGRGVSPLGELGRRQPRPWSQRCRSSHIQEGEGAHFKDFYLGLCFLIKKKFFLKLGEILLATFMEIIQLFLTSESLDYLFF